MKPLLLLFCGAWLSAQSLVEHIPAAAGLSRITVVTHAGDDRLFLCEQAGRIRIFQGGTLLATPFLDLSTLVQSSGNEQGLLGLAFHPDYDQNGFFFVNYTRVSDGGTVVARYQVSTNPDQANAGSAAILLQISQPFSNHNGGELQFGPDGYLYVALGDGGSGGDPGCRAQKLSEWLGKLLRLDVDQNSGQAPYYAVPSDNPFVGVGGAHGEIWAFGLRNPWRFSFDRETGDLFIGDVGQDSIEEIDFQPAGHAGGLNYGWKIMEGSNCYSGSACPGGTPACNSPSLTLPILQYPQAASNCSVTGGYVYRGCMAPSLVGRYLYGDYCTGNIWQGQEISPGSWTSQLLVTAGYGLTTFGEDRLGNLYVAMRNGPVYRLQESQLSSFLPHWHTNDLPCYQPMTILHLLELLP
jgi:glucose/arabinose dehydrogenase